MATFLWAAIESFRAPVPQHKSLSAFGLIPRPSGVQTLGIGLATSRPRRCSVGIVALALRLDKEAVRARRFDEESRSHRETPPPGAGEERAPRGRDCRNDGQRGQ